MSARSDKDPVSESIIRRFEDQWFHGSRPVLSEFVPHGDSQALPLLVELIFIDLECRLKTGESVLLESYLARYPELLNEQEALAKLLAAEWEFRNRCHQRVDVDEYRRRFPQLFDRLVQLVSGADSASPQAETLVENAPGLLSLGTSAHQMGGTPFLELPGYQIIEELGRGGMGVVYKARHCKLNRLVAIKMVLGAAHASRAELQRFAVEAQAVATLQHNNIVQIYEVGDHNGLPFLVLEYCAGGSLAKMTGGTPLEPSDAAMIVEKLAWAMEAAHGKQIIHRDLKPANVLVSSEETGNGEKDRRILAGTVRGRGEPKITDFGLAKKLDEAGQTHSGAIMGTPSYMAPEQAAGNTKEIGPLADVYSLGAMLYELLTGRPPFKAATAVETLRQVLSDEVARPSQLQSRTPRDLETICLKCLQKERGKRYESAAALAEDLHRFQAGEPIAARPSTSLERLMKWARRNPVVAALTGAVAATLVVATVVAWLLAGWALGEAKRADGEAGKATYQGRLAQQNERTAKTNEKIAKENEQKAKDALTEKTRQKKLADDNWERSEWKVYAGNIALALAAWQARDRPLMRHYLDQCRWDYRGWEYDYLWTLLNRDKTLNGHTDQILCVAFSPDGRRIVSGSRDKTLKVWDTVTGQELLTLVAHGDGVNCVVFSPDGRRIASGGGTEPGELKLWDAFTGQVALNLQGHTDTVTSVTFSPDGRRIVTGSRDKSLKMWDAATGQQLLTLEAHGHGVKCVVFSPDGRRIASAGPDNSGGTAKVWDSVTGQHLLTLKEYAFSNVSFSPDGQRIVSGRGDALTLWDAATGQVMLTPKGHRDVVQAVAFSPDGRLIVSGSRDTTLKVWDAASGREMFALQRDAGPVSPVNSVAFSPDGRRIVSGGWDGTLQVWDVSTVPETLNLKGPTGRAISVALSPDGRRIVSGEADYQYPGDLKVWDAASGQELLTLKGHTRGVITVAFSPDGRRIVSGSQDGTFKVWDAASGQEMLTFKGCTSLVCNLAFSPDSRCIIGGSGDKALKVWELATGQATLVLEGHTSLVTCVAFSPDGRRIVSGGWEVKKPGELKVWDVANGHEVFSLKGHTLGIFGVAFSPDSRRIISGSEDGTLKMWDAATGLETLTLKGHAAPVRNVAFSPDGRRLVSGGGSEKEPGELKVWDAATGQETLTLKEHTNLVRSVAFSPNGCSIVSAAGECYWPGEFGQYGELKVWDAGTGPETLTLKGHTAPVRKVAFSPDGQRIVSSAGGSNMPGELKVWDVVTGQETLHFNGQTPFESVAFGPDGQPIVISRDGKMVKVLDAATGKEVLTLKGHTDLICSVAVSPDGRRIASGSFDKTLKVWDAATGQETFTLKGHAAPVRDVAFSPDGRRIVSNGGTLKVWDAATGQEMLAPKGNKGSVFSVALIPSGQQPFTFAGHGGSVLSAASSPDGRRIVTGSNDQTLKVWDAATGQETLTLTGHTGDVLGVAFSQDARRLVSGSSDKTLKVWRLDVIEQNRSAKLTPPPTPSSHWLIYKLQQDRIRVTRASSRGDYFALTGNPQATLFQIDGQTGSFGRMKPNANPPPQEKKDLVIAGVLAGTDPKDRLMQKPHKLHTLPFKAEQDYTIELVSQEFDSYLRLEDAAGKELGSDDDGGGNLNSRLVFRAVNSADVRIIVTAYDDKFGRYTLTVHQGIKGGKGVKPATALGPEGRRQPDGAIEWNWDYGKLRVTQSLKTVADDKGFAQACLISYHVENNDDKPHTVGIRPIIDARVGANDAPAFAVPGSAQYITNAFDFKDSVPDFLTVRERAAANDPGIVAHLSLRLGGNLEAPQRVLLTNPKQKDILSNWNLATVDFMGDAAAIVYWEARELRPGARRSVGFAYGLQVVNLSKP